MTKVIFQIGLLAFCVAVVFFSLENTDMIDIVARSFMVFIAVVCASMVMFFVAASFSLKRFEEDQIPRHSAVHQPKAAAEAAK
jgi:hypothetical protein